MSALLWVLLAWPLHADAPAPAAAAPDEYEEPVLPLVATEPRTEEDEAKIRSAALYAQGRLLLRRDDRAGALRHFERAWRYNPQAVSLLPRIVFVAHQLKRSDEAARYALLAAEQTELNAPLLRQLAMQLSARHEWARAIRLFEKSLSLQEGENQSGQRDLGTLLVFLELGRLHFVSGEFAKAADYFGCVREVLDDPKTLAANPALEKALLGEAERTYRMLGESYYQVGRYDDAEAVHRKAFAKPQETDKGLLDFQLARVAAKRGDSAKALQHLDDYFATKSVAAGREPYGLLGEMVSKSVPDAKAAQEQIQARLDKLLENDSTNVALLAYLADRDRKAERLDLAEQRWEQLLVLEPTTEVYTALVEIHARQSRHDKLLEVCGLAVAKGSSLQDLGEMLKTVTEDKTLTAALADRAKKLLENHAEKPAAGALLAGSLLAEEIKDVQSADACFAAALSSLEPAAKPNVLTEWGLGLLLGSQYERAASILQEALGEKLPDERRLVCHFYLTRALALAKRTEEALEVARRGAALQADSPRMQAQTGWVLYHAKRYSDAEQAYLALVQKFDREYDSPVVRDVLRESRLVLSSICVQLGRMPDAEEWLEQVLDEFPEDVGAMNDLGYLWTEQGKNLQRAMAMVQKAVEAEPENAAYRDSLGWAYYRLGRYPEAVLELEKASAGEEPDGVILDHLGDAYSKVGQREKALAAWLRAVKAMAKDGDEAKAKAVQQKIDKDKQGS
jgi:tetratricopeptide (TPR) repeat protein